MKRLILVILLTIGWSAPALAPPIPDAKQCYQATLPGSGISPDRAILHCTRAIRSGYLSRRDKATTYNNRGIAYGRKGDLDRAIADYGEAIRLNPDYVSAYYNRGIRYRILREYDRAIADYNAVIRLKPDFAEALRNRGIAYSRKGDLDHAIADFDKAIGLKPNYADALRDRGYAYYLKGKYDQAIAGFTQSIRHQPKDALAFYNRAKAYRNKGEYDLAIRDFGQAIRLNPNDAHALNGKAWLLATAPQDGLRDGAEAVGLAKRAFSLSNRVGFLDTLAAAHAEAGDFKEAIGAQQRAIQMLRNQGKIKAIADYESRLRRYQQGRPFRN
ncbi:MAG: tetratricopeptide repeat protein [Rhodospirillales bacterium]